MARFQDERKATEVEPAFEVHLGEVSSRFIRINGLKGTQEHRRYCIVWINGKRWEGYLTQEEPEA